MFKGPSQSCGRRVPGFIIPRNKLQLLLAYMPRVGWVRKRDTEIRQTFTLITSCPDTASSGLNLEKEAKGGRTETSRRLMGAQSRLGDRSEMINPSETGAILHSARFARPVREIYGLPIADPLRAKREFRVKQKGSAEVRSVWIINLMTLVTRRYPVRLCI